MEIKKVNIVLKHLTLTYTHEFLQYIYIKKIKKQIRSLMLNLNRLL